MAQFTVYKARCWTSGKAYIGQTCRSLEARWSQHVRVATKGYVGCTLLSRAIRLHGADNFELTVLATCSSQAEVNSLERELISDHGTMTPNGYNLLTGGSCGAKPEHVRAAISASHLALHASGYVPPTKGKKRPAEVMRKLWEARTAAGTWGRPKGFTHSEETKAKMRLASAGKKRGPMSDAHKKAISEGQYGRRQTTKGATSAGQ